MGFQVSLDSSLFRASLRVEPLSRCAALSLPMDAIAVLPFCQTQVELEMAEQDPIQAKYVFTMEPRKLLSIATAGTCLICRASFLI